jgi:hypothetical protein
MLSRSHPRPGDRAILYPDTKRHRSTSCQTSINQADYKVMSLAERAAKAAKIAQEPELYKVCEGCDSIVTRRVSTCPNCHGYRFEEDPAEVIRQANILGSREKTSVLTEDLQ